MHRIEGTETIEQTGRDVSGLGDVNGDGYPDFLVGHRNWDGEGLDLRVGKVSVVSGQTGEILYSLTGGAAYASFGVGVAPVGDLDGDNIPDFIVGADNMGADNPLYPDVEAGKATVFSGISGEILFTFCGEQLGDNFGINVSGGGDVNRDGKPDIIVGAAFHDTELEDVGKVYVYSGEDGSLLWSKTGIAEGELFGWPSRIIGDVNGDGFSEFLVGAPYFGRQGTDLLGSGRAVVYSGMTGEVLYEYFGGMRENFGVSVSGIDDLNRDGFPDFLIGAEFAGSEYRGLIHVYSGNTGDLIFFLQGPELFESFGATCSTAGDVNGDGVPDIVVGAPERRTQENGGSIYVFSGKTQQLLFGKKGSSGDYLGVSVRNAGDLNQDGFEEVIAGAYNFSPPGIWRAGIAYVMAGDDFFLRTDKPAVWGGQLLDITASGLDPGTPVELIMTRIGQVPYYLTISRATLDARGEATFSVKIPQDFPSSTVEFQAVSWNPNFPETAKNFIDSNYVDIIVKRNPLKEPPKNKGGG